MNLKAYYDPKSDTIHNCIPYSYSWFHERRHQKQYKKIPFLDSVENWYGVLAYSLSGGMLIVFLVYSRLDLFLSFTGLVYSPIVILGLILEIDALIFGSIDWFRFKLKV